MVTGREDDGGIVTDLGTFVPAAGWYPDPAELSGQRWWSGQGWTEHVRATPVAPVPPVAPVAAAVPAVPAARAVPVGPGTPAAPSASSTAQPARNFGFGATGEGSGVEEPAPYRPFADRDALSAYTPAAPVVWARAPKPNPAATRAAVAATLVVAFVVARQLFHIAVGVPIAATLVAVIAGFLGLARSRTTFSGRKRSFVAVLVGSVGLGFGALWLSGTVATAAYDYTTEAEDSLLELYDSVNPAVAATSALCTPANLPRKGDTIPCTLGLAEGTNLDVVLNVTSDNGNFVVNLPG